MIIGPPLFAAGATSAATENSVQRSGTDHGACLWILDVRDGGSWNGTLKVAARIIGGEKHAGLSTYTDFIGVKNRDTEAFIDGDTGITAPGIYEVNLAGLEGRLEHTRVGGSVIVYDHILQG